MIGGAETLAEILDLLCEVRSQGRYLIGLGHLIYICFLFPSTTRQPIIIFLDRKPYILVIVVLVIGKSRYTSVSPCYIIDFYHPPFKILYCSHNRFAIHKLGLRAS